MHPQPYQFKSKPFAHQLECFERSRDREVFAILFEMGAGKSKVTVDTAAYLYSMGRINAFVIIAPNGVHSKWLKEDIPFSMPDYVEYRAAIWETSNKKAVQACEDLLKPGHQLRILCMNVECFSSKKGAEFLQRFLNATDALLAIDESSRIKNPEAQRTKNICKLGDKAKYRRILTGTPISNSPFDLYAQFMFLDTSILGQSYFAFKATYAEMADATDPMVAAIMRKNNLRFAPQMVKKDPQTGKAKYRNLDKLKEIIAPHSMRVTKEECLDLPDKIYEKRYFKMTPAQAKVYEQLRTKSKTELANMKDKLTVMHKMTLMLRLQQVASGYMPTDDGRLVHLHDAPMDNPRIACLMDSLEDIEGSVIIWCRFVEEIKMIASLLGDDCVMYYGGIDTDQRKQNMEDFKAGKKRFFIGNVATGGIGLNLTQAATVVYYSNTFSYEDRKQSEDRAHRIGQKSNVLYLDLQCEDTVDQHILRALQNKEDLATYMTDLKDFMDIL